MASEEFPRSKPPPLRISTRPISDKILLKRRREVMVAMKVGSP